MTITEPRAAEHYVEDCDLPDEPLGLRDASPALPTFGSQAPQAIAVGSQIAEFSAKVPASIRSGVANSFLFAQLAANKHITRNGGSTLDWYAKYNEVLANTGWLIEGSANTMHEVKGTGLEVHREILPVIAAALGPAVAAAAVVTAALNGLANMDKDSPWLTLFSRESQRAQANQFQVAYVDVKSAAPVIKLAGFELDASRSVTQVLFFKFSDGQAKLRHYSSTLSANQAVFEAIQGAVAQRVAAFIASSVAAIEI